MAYASPKPIRGASARSRNLHCKFSTCCYSSYAEINFINKACCRRDGNPAAMQETGPMALCRRAAAAIEEEGGIWLAQKVVHREGIQYPRDRKGACCPQARSCKPWSFSCAPFHVFCPAHTKTQPLPWVAQIMPLPSAASMALTVEKV